MEFKWDIHVPQISRMNTDFLTYSVRFTQIFPSTISYSQMRPIRSDLRRFFDLFGQMTQIFPTAVTSKGYFRMKGDDVICSLCLAKLLYCGEVFDMHTLPEGIQ